jgi:uncharacterized protein YggE
MRRRIAIITMALAAWSAAALAQAPPDQGTIAVQGTGTVEVVPDVADIVIGVRNEAQNPAEAIDSNAEAMKRVVDDAKRAGIEARDIQTSVLNLGQSRDAKNVLKFVAVNTVRIRLRDLSRLGSVARSLVSSGANEMRNIRFSTANPGPHLDRARRQAVEDARRRAEVLVKAADRRLGEIVEITESTDDGPGVVPMARAAQAADIPTEPGQIALRATVQIKWRLTP